LNWNIRGLNDEAKHRVVRSKIEESSCAVFCIQDTKMPVIDHSTIKKIAPKRFSEFAFAPSFGASSGILMCWNESLLEGEIISMQSFSITVSFKSKLNNQQWKLTTVYGPSHGDRRNDFTHWLYTLQIRTDENWMLIGDFNFYRSPDDRNRDGAKYSDMETFNSIISHLGLVEIPLKRKKIYLE
jgi:exonuclease III